MRQVALSLDVEHLAAAIHPVGGVDSMRQECRPIAVLRQLRGFKAVRPAPQGAAPLGLFAFRIGHDVGKMPRQLVRRR